MNIYKDGVAVDDGTGGTTGTYTAMEDTASLTRLATRYTTNERFYNGGMALAVAMRKELSVVEVWQIKEFINGFFDLSL